MQNRQNEHDYFGENFEVTYTEELPPLDFDSEENLDRTPVRRASSSRRSEPRRKPKTEEHLDETCASDLASPIRRPVQTGTKAVEKLTFFVLGPAPVLMAGIITLITCLSFWDGHLAYGELYTLSSGENMALLLYLAVGGVLVLWEVCSFLFALSGLSAGSGRGLTFFILVYVSSYIASVAYASIPGGIEILDGIRGGLQIYGALYPRFFPFCILGLAACILKKVLKKN